MTLNLFEKILLTCMVVAVIFFVIIIIGGVIFELLVSFRAAKNTREMHNKKPDLMEIERQDKKIICINGSTNIRGIRGIIYLHEAEEEIARIIAGELVKQKLIHCNTIFDHDTDSIKVQGSIQVVIDQEAAHEN